jgi:hypothetical protein
MRIDVVVHGTIPACEAAGEAAGLHGRSVVVFSYAAAAHTMTYEVDPLTGQAVLVAVDGNEFK